jgi:isoleucyl-tRNA synthetase
MEQTPFAVSTGSLVSLGSHSFDVDGVREIVGKFIGYIEEYLFLLCYLTNIDGYDASSYSLDWQRIAELDRWIISRLHSLKIKCVNGWKNMS